jgi:hypothetical protein
MNAHRSHSPKNQKRGDPLVMPSNTELRPAPSPVGEPERFLQFARENVGLLAAVASFPIFSQVLNILSPPQVTAHTLNLTVLSAFTCLIIFSGTFLLRSVVGWFTSQKHLYLRAVPFAVAIVTIASALLLVVEYS